MRNYLLCYDIADEKRLYRVAKLCYAYALGGQKSALEMPLEREEIAVLRSAIEQLIDPQKDRVHFVPFLAEPELYGRADFVTYEEGMIIL